jgi:hypothetical protein
MAAQLDELTEYLMAEAAERERSHPRSAVAAVPMPAAGGGFTVPVPGTQEWEVLAVSFKLVASAVAGSRIAVLTYTDPDGIAFAALASPFTVAASNTSRILFASGIQQSGANNAGNIATPVPPFKLGVGSSLVVTVLAVDVADQISEARVTYNAWNVRP